MRINLWNRVYNGGWIWFDVKQIKRFDCGGFGKDYKYAYLNNGKPDIDRSIWWCFFGFCGRIYLQKWPWQK
ncbi:hypothetical protein QML66_27745 [Klebsiella pneumoniae]|uniref:hypothetical protein n=1 Tax=Klebsiella pneumoniae TaxID=573 RepID=UPI003A8C7379